MSPTPPPQTEITPKTDVDAVARAAVERAEKLERQNAELKKQLESARSHKGSKEASAGVSELQAEIARLRAEREEFLDKMEAAASIAADAKRGPKPLAPEHRGTKKYRVKQHYRGGIMYGPGQQGGEYMTVTDEKPGKGWVEVKTVAATQLVEVVPDAGAQKRTADQDV